MPNYIYGVTGIQVSRDPARKAWELRHPAGSSAIAVHLQRISVISPTGEGVNFTLSKYTSLATHSGSPTQITIPQGSKPAPKSELWMDDTGSEITWNGSPTATLSKTVDSSAHWNVTTTSGYAHGLAPGECLAIELTDSGETGNLDLEFSIVEQV